MVIKGLVQSEDVEGNLREVLPAKIGFNFMHFNIKHWHEDSDSNLNSFAEICVKYAEGKTKESIRRKMSRYITNNYQSDLEEREELIYDYQKQINERTNELKQLDSYIKKAYDKKLTFPSIKHLRKIIESDDHKRSEETLRLQEASRLKGLKLADR